MAAQDDARVVSAEFRAADASAGDARPVDRGAYACGVRRGWGERVLW
jgi:hypothetical protein